jgi:hypothetical protein
MLLAALILIGVVGGVILLALLFARDPVGDRDASSELERFLAEARGDRPNREVPPAPRSIPTARPRPRPVPKKPEPVPVPPVRPPETPAVIIRQKIEPDPVPVVEPIADTTPVLGSAERRANSPAAERLLQLLRDRTTLQAAFLLNEVLRPPKCKLRGR